MKKYIVPFIITVILFVVAFYLSSLFANRKIDQVKIIQDKISTDILSTETRFILLGSSSCEHVKSSDEFENSLNDELSEMAKRVKFMESQLGSKDERVLLIKDKYALLQIKDYLLREQLSDRCGEEIPTILYFHSLDCDKCKEQSVVLDEINRRYPSIRIYWFDADSNTPALRTLISMFGVNKAPSVIIRDDKYEGFKSLEEMEEIIPIEKTTLEE
ncbi:MAG: thioredoxin family protein [Patescibacteria group bacterium]|nr:thioredoxin family protein [Patescibacteria group bacterium]